MKHKTLWLVVFWLMLFASLLVLQAIYPSIAFPLSVVVDIAGTVSFAYVGIDKTKLVVAAAHAPQGEFGYAYIPPIQDKHLWIVIAWLFLCVLSLIIQSLLSDDSVATLPLANIMTAAGILTAAYVALDKGAKVAAITGKDK